MIVKVIITLLIMSSVKLNNGKHLKGVSYNFRAHSNPNFISISDSLNEHHGCVATDDTGTFVNGLFKDATTKEYFKDDIVELLKKDFLDRCLSSAGASTREQIAKVEEVFARTKMYYRTKDGNFHKILEPNQVVIAMETTKPINRYIDHEGYADYLNLYFSVNSLFVAWDKLPYVGDTFDNLTPRRPSLSSKPKPSIPIATGIVKSVDRLCDIAEYGNKTRSIVNQSWNIYNRANLPDEVNDRTDLRKKEGSVCLSANRKKFDNDLTIVNGTSYSSYYVEYPKGAYNKNLLFMCTGDVFYFLGEQNQKQRQLFLSFLYPLEIDDKMKKPQAAQVFYYFYKELLKHCVASQVYLLPWELCSKEITSH